MREESSLTLSEIPSKIKSLVNQYSKIAIGNYHLSRMEYDQLYDIMTNLNFIPNRVFVLFAYSENRVGGFADSIKNTNSDNALRIYIGSRLHKCIFVYSFNKTKITIGNGHNTMIFENCDLTWIAIG